MACGHSAAGLPRPLSRFIRASGAGTRSVLTTGALPPIFLAPAAFAHSFATQPPARGLAARSKPKDAPTSSAHNMRAVLRRLGKADEWREKAPPSRSIAHQETSSPKPWRAGGPADSNSPPTSRFGASKRVGGAKRGTQPGFRIRSQQLLDRLNQVIRDIQARPRHSSEGSARSDADAIAALEHLDQEMKVLRVMLKSKDVLIDPDNARKSASRIRTPYNAGIRICFEAGKIERAFKLLNQMKKDGIFPNSSTYTIALQGLTRNYTRRLTSSTPSESPVGDTGLQNLIQRADQIFQDVERLWQQAFPQYFRRARGPSPVNIGMHIDNNDFDKLTDQARRNLVSQQASVLEAQQFPRVLTNTINAYLNFLRVTGRGQEQVKIFDQLFPSALIDDLARGLAPDATPQQKLELINRKLSDCLPLGDVATFTSVVSLHRDAHNAQHQIVAKRLWTLIIQLMEIERQQAPMQPSSDSRQRRQTASNAAAVAAVDTTSSTSGLRFLPDDRLVSDFFIRIAHSPDADAKSNLRFGLSILAKVYGLNIESMADGIIRDPQNGAYTEAYGPERYLVSHGDIEQGSAHSFAEFKDPHTITNVLRAFATAQPWQNFVALFNYFWSKAHVEDHGDAGNSLPENPTVFGDNLQVIDGLRLLWVLGEAGDPIGARVVLEAMKRAAAHQANVSERKSKAGHRRGRRSDAFKEEPQTWEPADLAYVRAMRANLVAAYRSPNGLTGQLMEKSSAAHSRPGGTADVAGPTYDPWSEAKSLISEFGDKRAKDGAYRHKRQAHENKFGADGRIDGARRSREPAADVSPDWMARIHSNTIVAFFLNITRICAAHQPDNGTLIAREALTLLEEKFGLEELVAGAQSLQLEMDQRKEADTADMSSIAVRRLRTMANFSKVTALALETSDRSFAPKEDVQLWKNIRKLLATVSTPEQGEQAASQGRRARAGLAGGNLLLSKDDYLELEAEAEVEDFEDPVEGEGEGLQGYRGSQRKQSRSRHVEQELQRWVRGASS